MDKCYSLGVSEIVRIADAVVHGSYVDGTSPRKVEVLDFYDPESLSLVSFRNNDYGLDEDDDNDDVELKEIEEKPKKEKKKKPKSEKNKKSKPKAKKKKADKDSDEIKNPKRVYVVDENISDLERREIRVDMVNLLAQRDRIKRKLGKLDVGKKKDSMKIAELNIELCAIDDDIKTLENISGEPAPDLNRGSGFRRFVGGVKRKVKKVCNRVKKFFNRNSEAITGISILSLPIVLSLGARLLARIL